MAPRLPIKARGPTFLQIAAIVLAGAWVFCPALRGGWLWDDQSFLGANGVVRDPSGLWKIWFAPQGPDYSPLQTSVQWILWRLAGANPLGYHLANAGLQLLSAFLLWRVLQKCGVRPAWVGGLLFMVHPLAVGAVARIPELGACLALPLLLLAFSGWIEFEKIQSSQLATKSTESTESTKKSNSLSSLCSLCSLWPKDWNWFGLSLICFVAALLSSASAWLFPVVLMLHAWWKHRRITRADWRAIEPFFAVLLMFAVVILCMRSYSTTGAAAAGIFSRLAAAGLAAGSYLLQCLVPLRLDPIHPRAYLPLAILAGLGAAALGAFFGSRAFRAFPAPTRAVFFAAVAVVVAAFACAGRGYARVFTDDGTFWTAAVDRDPDSPVVQYNLGLLLVGSHQLPEGIDHFETALRLQPDYAQAQGNLAIALSVAGRPAEAIPHFEKALELNSDSAQLRYNFGLALHAAGRPDEARAQWEAAARILRGGSADAPSP